jgi:hypothetical protein
MTMIRIMMLVMGEKLSRNLLESKGSITVSSKSHCICTFWRLSNCWDSNLYNPDFEVVLEKAEIPFGSLLQLL